MTNTTFCNIFRSCRLCPLKNMHCSDLSSHIIWNISHQAYAYIMSEIKNMFNIYVSKEELSPMELATRAKPSNICFTYIDCQQCPMGDSGFCANYRAKYPELDKAIQKTIHETTLNLTIIVDTMVIKHMGTKYLYGC